MKDVLCNVIEERGFIGMSEVIATALYHPKYGYYTTKEVFGRQGDFVTSPHISNIFSQIIALFFVYHFKKNCKGGDRVHFVELGSGDGTFLHDSLEVLSKSPGFLTNGKVHSVDISPKNLDIQRQKLQKFEEDVDIEYHQDFYDFLDYIENQKSLNDDDCHDVFFIFANEFLDAFAVNQYIKLKDGSFGEVVLTKDDQNTLHFAFTKVDYIDKIRHYLSLSDNTEESVEDGGIVEISENAISIFADICKLVKQNNGVFMAIDYGYLTNKFISTIQSIKNHEPVDILENVGDADITHLIDFELYKNIATKSGLMVYEPVTQGDFLTSVGIKEKLALVLSKIEDKGLQAQITDSVARLVDPSQMGDLFKVLIAEHFEV